MDYEAYYNRMDLACTELAQAMATPNGQNCGILDSELVSRAAAKIVLMRKMLLATGLSKGILEAIMDE